MESDQPETIALTGASGFIGRYIIEKLLDANPASRLTNLDLEKPTFDASCAYLQGDVRDKAATDQLCEHAQVCIHLAAAHRDSGIAYDEYFSVNQQGTETLLQSMSEQGVRNMVFFSSVAVYDPAAEGPICENTMADPQSPYGASKLAAEGAIKRWVDDSPERSALLIRPTVVIGPRNVANMYSLIDQIYRGRYLFNFGGGNNVKSVAVVMNVAEFVCWYIQNKKFVGGETETYNFVDSPQLAISETIDIIHQELGVRPPRITVPMAAAVTGGRVFDVLAKATGKELPISSARVRKLATSTRFEADKIQASGFQSRFSTEEGVRRMVRWFLASDRGAHESPVDWLGAP